MKTQLKRKEVANLLKKSNATIKRLHTPPTSEQPSASYDENFPVPVNIGRVPYYQEDLVLEWLSGHAGCEVTKRDELLTTNDLMLAFGRSSVWIWSSEKNGNIPKSFYINNSKYWLSRWFDDLGEVA